MDKSIIPYSIKKGRIEQMEYTIYSILPLKLID